MPRLACLLILQIAGFSLPAQQKSENQFFALAQQKMKTMEWERAKDYLNQCLIAIPTFAEGYAARGEVNEKLSKPTEALTDYSIAIELAPETPDIYLKRGVLALQLGRLDLSRSDFRKLLSLGYTETNTIYFRQSNDESVDKVFTLQSGITDMVYNYLGLVETKAGDYNTAILYFDSAIRVNSKAPDYYAHRGLAYLNQKENQKATIEFEKALAVDPGHSISKNNLAIIKRQEGKLDEAERYLNEAKFEANSTSGHYASLALVLLESGRYKEAILNFDSAIALDPKEGELFINRGLAKEKLNDWKSARRDFDKAIQIDSEWPKAWFVEGNHFMKQKQWQQALENYSVAITLDEDYALAYYNRAIVRHQLRHFNEACTDLQKAESLGMTIEAKMKSKFCRE
jgi:tetratricopeptide (TPR) repeat protein